MPAKSNQTGLTHSCDVQLQIRNGAAVIEMDVSPRQCFTRETLSRLNDVLDVVAAANEGSVSHALLLSGDPRVYNYGGDLSFFVHALEGQDEQALMAYGLACTDLVHRWFTGLNAKAITVSVVEGDALGGGFEAALAANVLVAEQGTTFGFPELMFNVFPGMGGFNMIAHKTSVATAKKIVLSAKRYSAEQLYELGLVDVLAEKGQGRCAAFDYIRNSGRRLNGEIGLRRSMNLASNVNPQVLEQTVAIWVETVLKMTPKNLRLIRRLIRKQQSNKASRKGAVSTIVRFS